MVSAGILLAQAGVEEKEERQLAALLRAGNARRYGQLLGGSHGRGGVYAHRVGAGYGDYMNEPSLPKFEPMLKKDGLMIINSSLINSRPARTDIKAVCVPCNEIAQQVGSPRVANLVALGAFCKLTGAVEVEGIVHAMKKVFKRAKPEMLELNKKALQAGFDYVK